MEHRQWVSRYREELKGLAALWIVFFHTRLYLPDGLDLIRGLGYGGVDIFLFLMGMGLQRSLSKGEELRGYVRRRLRRVLPAYLPVLLLWMAVMYPTFQLSLVQNIRGVAGNLFMVGYWLGTPKVFNWYANAQFLYFLVAPLFFAVLSRSRKPFWGLAALMALCLGVGAAAIGQEQMMGISRLPVLLLGMAFGMDWPVSARKGLVRVAYAGGALAAFAVLVYCYYASPILLNDFGMYWYPFAFIAPALCVGVAFVMHKVQGVAKWFAPLRLLGGSSFEIYLVNIWLYEEGKRRGLQTAWQWLLLAAASLLLGIGYHMLVERLSRPKAHGDAPTAMEK